jgi:hypothetical protein
MPALPKFAHSPASINPGSCSMLSWSTSGAASIAITRGTLTTACIMRIILFLIPATGRRTHPCRCLGNVFNLLKETGPARAIVYSGLQPVTQD